MKYEETVDAANRWSKPHVPTAQMHALSKLRKAFANGTCVIGLGTSGDPEEENEEPREVAGKHKCHILSSLSNQTIWYKQAYIEWVHRIIPLRSIVYA